MATSIYVVYLTYSSEVCGSWAELAKHSHCHTTAEKRVGGEDDEYIKWWRFSLYSHAFEKMGLLQRAKAIQHSVYHRVYLLIWHNYYSKSEISTTDHYLKITLSNQILPTSYKCMPTGQKNLYVEH